MQAIAYYLLQVMICSVLLMGYYWLFLRNERFHRYNRFYLLSIAVLCWVIPLVRIQLQVPDKDTGDVYRLMTVVADQQTYWETTVQSASFHLGWEEIVWIVYTVVTSLLMLGLFRAILKIRLLLNKHACRKIQDVYIIMTQVQGTPFSFFKYIFWHTDIDLRSDDGQRMLEHELTHVREWHSVDKLLIQLLLVFGWINPILWLIKKELEMIHEFIADQKAVRDGDTAALASMLLTAIYPQQRTLLTHSFFFSPIKRRILMLTKNNHPRFSYFRRVVVLPIAICIVLFFSFRISTRAQESDIARQQAAYIINDAALSDSLGDLKKPKVVSIYGSFNTFFLSADKKSLYETFKDSLGFGKNIIYQVNGKEVSEQQALSMNPAAVKCVNIYGGEIAIEKFGQQACDGVVDIILNDSEATKVDRSRPVRLNEIIVPSSPDVQPLYYLNGIRLKNIAALNKIEPNNIATVNVLKNEKAVEKYGKEGIRGVVEIFTKDKKTIEVVASDPAGVKDFQKRNPQIKQVYWKHSPLRMIVALKDGTEESYDLTSEASKNRAVKKYGKLPMPAPPPPPLPAPIVAKEQDKPIEVYDRIFTKVQEPASFPGGKEAWQKYLERNLGFDVPVKNGAPPGQYGVTVRFIVDEQGGISNVEAENDPGYGTAAEAVNLIKKGPGWMPAKQNGKNVKYWMKQNITFVVSED